MTKPRGLAALSPERRREIAAQGGRASSGAFAHVKGLAKAAGQISGRSRKAKSADRDLVPGKPRRD